MTNLNTDLIYKFTSFETAIKIVKNCYLRFSSPILFNDPFDGQCKLKCPFTAEEVLSELVKLAHEKLKNDSRIYPIRPILAYINDEISKYDIANITSEELEEITQSARHFYDAYKFSYPEDPAHRSLTEIKWTVPFINKHRICSMSRTDSLITMWSYYADQHKGVCLGFDRSLYDDKNQITCHDVKYVEELPQINDLRFWAQAATANYPLTISEYVNEYLISKSTAWQNEHEIRFTSYVGVESSDLYVDHGFESNFLKKVILGARTSDIEKERMKSLLQGHLNKCELYKAVRSDSQFKLEFREVDKGLE